jgi:hypothetical protein
MDKGEGFPYPSESWVACVLSLALILPSYISMGSECKASQFYEDSRRRFKNIAISARREAPDLDCVILQSVISTMISNGDQLDEWLEIDDGKAQAIMSLESVIYAALDAVTLVGISRNNIKSSKERIQCRPHIKMMSKYTHQLAIKLQSSNMSSTFALSVAAVCLRMENDTAEDVDESLANEHIADDGDILMDEPDSLRIDPADDSKMDELVAYISFM